jgi:hypothetical protein
MREQRAVDAQMRRHRAAEQPGEQNGAENGRARDRVQQCAEQRENAKAARLRHTAAIAELLHGLGNLLDRHQLDPAIHHKKENDEAAENAADPERGTGNGHEMVLWFE